MRKIIASSVLFLLLASLTEAQPPASRFEEDPEVRYNVNQTNAPGLTSSRSSASQTNSVARFPTRTSFFNRSAISTEEANVNKLVLQATQKLQTSEASQKATAESELRDALEKLFDLRSGTREKQIDDLESRLKKLRNQLEERKRMKDEIVDLRVQTVVNETKGLTF